MGAIDTTADQVIDIIACESGRDRMVTLRKCLPKLVAINREHARALLREYGVRFLPRQVYARRCPLGAPLTLQQLTPRRAHLRA